MLPAQCPLCGALPENQSVVTSHVYGAKSGDRAFFWCNSCDVRYLYPRLSAEDEQKFYRAEFEGFMNSRSGDSGGWTDGEHHVLANEATRLRRMKYLPPLSEGSRILEIGCSSGFMLYPLHELGHCCVGVEPSGLFRAYLSDRGIKNYASLEEVPPEVSVQGFDLIMHFFVLEHIGNALEFLQVQLRMLKRGGLLVFEVPNVSDPLASIYDVPEFERFYWSIAHPWYFSERSLSYLLEKVRQKYEIKFDQRYDLSNHMIWARDGRPGGQGVFADMLGDELNAAYKQALIERKHCDTLIGFIQKL